MIESIQFKNFKALRDTTLQLKQFTLIVGPNGSGKSTALSAVSALESAEFSRSGQLRSIGVGEGKEVALRVKCDGERSGWDFKVVWTENGCSTESHGPDDSLARGYGGGFANVFGSPRMFSLEANAIARPVQLQPFEELHLDGANLAGVLDRLRDQNPERFELVNEELSRWIPEFNRILFETPGPGLRAIALRTREGSHSIKAADLSQGTLIALALLTIAYLPEPPSIVCLEEPDHGLHPRLLRDVRDAIYRLAYPEGAQEKREPVQVIATTHNPYFLDLFREHPEEIVIAEKVGLEAKFSRLSDRPDLEEILGDAPLSEVWYSGVLGGVPVGT